MSQQLYKVIWKRTKFPLNVSLEMVAFLGNFKNDNGEISLDEDRLEEELKDTEITSGLQPLIKFLRKDLADGEQHDYGIG